MPTIGRREYGIIIAFFSKNIIMNNKLLLGAAVAGLAAMFIKRKRDAKRNLSTTGYAPQSNTFKKDRHRTDVFSQAKSSGSGAWESAPEPLK